MTEALPVFPSEAVEQVAPTTGLCHVDENLGEVSSATVGDQVATAEAVAAVEVQEGAGDRDVDGLASEHQPSVEVGVEDDSPAIVEVNWWGTMVCCFCRLPVSVCLFVCLAVFGLVRWPSTASVEEVAGSESNRVLNA